MKITFKPATIQETGLAIFPIFEGVALNGVGVSLPLNFKGLSEAADFKGKKGQEFSVYALDGSKANQIVFIGAGKRAEFNVEMFAATVAKRFIKCFLATVAANISTLNSVLLPAPMKTI